MHRLSLFLHFAKLTSMESDDRNILTDDANESQGHENKSRRFKLEPALVLIFFGWNLASSIIPNQLLRETCLEYGFNVTECSQLGVNNSTKEIEEKIQPHVAEIIMTISLLNSIIPAVMSLFLGPWTDKFGRKKVICATFIGFSLSQAALCLVSFISDHLAMMNPWIYVLTYIPIIITGGWPSMIVAILCYITDLTTEVRRSTRLALIEMLIFIGVLLGTASSSYILNLTCPTVVFALGTMCVALGTIYTIIFVDESVKDMQEASVCGQLKELVSPGPVVEMLRTCFKRRSFHERRILWSLIVILMFTIFTMNGTGNVAYLFVREKFQWTLKDSTLYDSSTMLITIVGCLIGLVVMKKLLNISDLTLVFVSIISMLVDAVIKAFAQTPIQMYVSSGISLFRVLCAPMCRSLISTIIPSNEIGKVFSITSSFEAVSSLIASPLYTFIYSRTFTFFAGAFYLISACVYVISLILAFGVMRMKKTREGLMNTYTQINDS